MSVRKFQGAAEISEVEIAGMAGGKSAFKRRLGDSRFEDEVEGPVGPRKANVVPGRRDRSSPDSAGQPEKGSVDKRRCDGAQEDPEGDEEMDINHITKQTDGGKGTTDIGGAIWDDTGQASAAENRIYEVVNLQINMDMRKQPTEEGIIWASKWKVDQAGYGKEQKWTQALLRNIEWLARKILRQEDE
jgi:hypothetical protein